MAKMTVTKNTTAVEISSMLAQAKPDEKIKAKKVGEDKYILYTKPSGKGSTSLIDKITKNSAEKTNRARGVIREVLDRTEKHAQKQLPHGLDHNDIRTAVSKTEKFVAEGGTHAMRVGKLNIGMAGVAGEKIAADMIGAKAYRFPEGAKLNGLQPTYNQAASELKAGNRSAALDRLGDEVAKAVKQKFTAREQDNFAFSPGFGFRRHLENEMRKALGSDYDTVFKNSTDADTFMRDVFNKAAAKVPADKQVNSNTISLTKTVNGNQVTVNYVKGAQIGAGGFAKVYVYTNANDPKDKIAVKMTEVGHNDEKTDSNLENGGREVPLHRKLQNAGSDAIIGFKGAFRTEQGQVGIALEFAPRGSGEKLMSELANARKNGNVSDNAATVLALGVIKKVAEGIRVQEGEGIKNGDVKLPNVLFTEDGEPKMSDFGTAQENHVFVLSKSPNIDNVDYQAPEMLKAKSKAAAAGGINDTAFEPIRKGNMQVIKGVFKGKGAAAEVNRNNLYNHIVKPHMLQEKQRASGGDKVDSWGLGVMLLELMKGDKMLPPTGDHWKKIQDFGNDVNNVAVGPNGYFGPSTGNALVDSLINALMHPDPAQRLTADAALRHPAMQMAGIGGDAAKELMKAVLSGDVAGMKQASAVMQPPSDLPPPPPSPFI